MFQQPVTEVIRQRYSCRNYENAGIEEGLCQALLERMAQLPPGPFGSAGRFVLASADQEDRSALRGLGTYGFLRGVSAFLIGATRDAGKNLEDFGYQMEYLILQATDLGLQTCWLGGTFTRSAFSRKISAGEHEVIPAVTAIGHRSEDRRGADEAKRMRIGGHERLPWQALFFDGDFDHPLSQAQAGVYATPLEMLRLGPSASNKQPWRVIRQADCWHFYLQRTPGYLIRPLNRLVGITDLQRTDMGIAMCHFALAAAEAGLKGEWVLREPVLSKPDRLTEYAVSWVAK